MKLYILGILAYGIKSISVADCSYLGTPDTSLNTCNCEKGWIGPTCNKLNFTSIPESSSAYSSGIYTPDFSTWGGSILKVSNKYFAFVSTIRNGMQCWANTSGCGILQADDINGPWQLVSHIPFGDFPGYNKDDVPWCHNFMATIEYKLANASDPNSNRTYAFVGYGIMKKFNNNGKIALANFGPRTPKICTEKRWAIPFPVDSQNQQMHVVYKELAAKTPAALEKELLTMLQARTFKQQINGFNYSDYLSTGLKWVNLAEKIPNVPLNAVNPAPLISYATNQGTLVKRRSGEHHRVLSFRYAKSKECIGLLGLRGDKFIWEQGAQYYRGPTISQAWNIEDPFFYESENGFHLIVHDGRVCGPKKKWNACGSIMHHSKNKDFMDSAQGWSKPKLLYNANIPALKTQAQYRQRPVLFCNESAPRALLTGTIIKEFKKSSTFVVRIG